jgi:hypothetical protein
MPAGGSELAKFDDRGRKNEFGVCSEISGGCSTCCHLSIPSRLFRCRCAPFASLSTAALRPSSHESCPPVPAVTVRSYHHPCSALGSQVFWLGARSFTFVNVLLWPDPLSSHGGGSLQPVVPTSTLPDGRGRRPALAFRCVSHSPALFRRLLLPPARLPPPHPPTHPPTSHRSISAAFERYGTATLLLLLTWWTPLLLASDTHCSTTCSPRPLRMRSRRT